MVCLVWPGSNANLKPMSKFYCSFLYGWIREWTRWRESCVLIGYPSGQDDGLFLPARYFWRWSHKKKISFWLYKKSLIDQACAVKMAVYWPHSFLHFYWLRLRLGQKKTRKQLGQYPVNLTSRLFNNATYLSSALRSVACEVPRLTLAIVFHRLSFLMLFYVYFFCRIWEKQWPFSVWCLTALISWISWLWESFSRVWPGRT